jgi:hypothetical protein
MDLTSGEECAKRRKGVLNTFGEQSPLTFRVPATGMKRERSEEVLVTL